jgi:hypothetical protein
MRRKNRRVELLSQGEVRGLLAFVFLGQTKLQQSRSERFASNTPKNSEDSRI